jgi:hypothetical protein
MKKLIQILIVTFLITNCGRLLRKDKTDQRVTGNQNSKSKEKLNNGIFLYDESQDTIKTDTFLLKNDYKLIVFPNRIEESENRINFNFLGKDIDTIIMSDVISTRKNTVYFDGSDFSNFFAIKQSGGTNIKFFLFDKKKLNQSLIGIEVKFDLKNELIIYKDEKYNLFLFDCKSNRNIPINIPYNELKKYDCMKYGNIESEINVKKVSNYFYYFGFNLCDSTVIFKIKR